MKTLKKLYLLPALAAIALFNSSCEKVIQVDLNSKDPQILIEARLPKAGPCVVSITKTVNFDQTNVFPGVAGAVVTLSDEDGNSEVLPMTGVGTYLSTMAGIEGKTYTLHVAVEGKTYTAKSTMPLPVLMSSLTYDSIGFFGKQNYFAVPHINDPKGIANYYHFHLFVNGARDKTVMVQDDQFTDGNVVTQPLFGDLEIVKGDTVQVEMFNVDQPVYKYFFSLSQTQDGSATPANPVSNFTGGCLGYFSAYTNQINSVIIN
jgi:hypothetical protein